VSKGDTLAAKPFIDDYFAKVKPDDPEFVPKDYLLKATIYSAIPGQEAVVVSSLREGVKADTILTNKLEILKDAIKLFAERKRYDLEAAMWDILLEVKPNPIINDLFGATVAHYRSKTPAGYTRAYLLGDTMTQKWPDQMFGYEWRFNAALVLDTVKKDSIMIPAAMSLLEFSLKDTAKYFRQISNSSYRIALYHNEKDDRAKAVEYLRIMKSATKDTAQQNSIQKNIDQLSKQQSQGTRPGAPRSSTTGPARKTNGS
jgi:hypothetical protein